MASERRLKESLEALGLLTPSDPAPTTPTLYPSIACTIAEELDPSFPPTPPDLESHLEPLLRRLGYLGDPASPLPVLSFLSSALCTHRILASRDVQAKLPADKRDVILAAAVSRLQAAIPHPHRAAPEDAEQLAALMQSLSLAVEKRVAESADVDALFGRRLLDEEDVAMEAAACESLRRELVKEHDLRKRLMLHRLEVTVRAFSQSERADNTKFDAIMEGVRQLAEEQGEVSHFEVLAAREWALRPERAVASMDESGVKNVVMGSVPDRGGRIGRGAGAKMPGFRVRIPLANDQGRGKKGKDWKGKGGKRQRWRA